MQFTIEEPFANGGFVTVFRGQEAIGRGFVANGVANVIPDVPFDEQDKLTLSLQQDGALPADEAVENPPPKQTEQPPAEPVETKLTHSCPADGSYTEQFTTTGRLTPGFAGATIKLTYTRDDGTTLTRNETTDANGSWSDTITPQQHDGPNPFFEFGTWKVRANYDGDAGHKASSSPDCSFVVND